jgi:hypothetical protein
MIKKLKLIFYITSAVVLGLLTIWQIYTVRLALVSSNGKAIDSELSQIKDVVAMWSKRTPFNADNIGKEASPSSTAIPKPKVTAEPEEKSASQSAEN